MSLNPTASAGKYIKTEYAYIRRFMEDLHHEYDRDIDLFVHFGQASGWDFVSVERVAYRQGMTSGWWTEREKGGKAGGYYMIPDDKGEVVTDAGRCPWEGLPMGLQSALDIDAVVEGAKGVLASRARFGEGQVSGREGRAVACQGAFGGGTLLLWVHQL